MVSVLILTLNEEDNLPKLLKSLEWCDDIVVFDSYSDDSTVDIAKNADARVVQREFDNWASHQNWALENIEFENQWIYYSDADEVVTPELRDELLSIATNAEEDKVAYWVRFKNYFMGRWIKHCGIYPTWVLRFFKPEKVEWRRLVNPKPEINGDAGYLENHFEHYSFRKGMNHWFHKHNQYSYKEAQESIQSLDEESIEWKKMVSKNPAVRRDELKKLSFRLPFRPFLRFIYMYFLKLGFLDGKAGFHYCCLLSIYEYMITLKIKEIQLEERGLSL